ncbi:PGN_0703 family putative restriction endonuclease [Lutibacter maritimus]|uniref:PD-(D/E)XK nuclease superfamily protein n=1 Tax=Lutibacter maritimus TaxID=593133 RepID=A0A1I6SWN5_9FLAO|nr:hypothetical protein [Lutibacter maritimus]SFS81282.1 hypothetical protein SAMN04488006_0170 [Lutibacter maritimus]
MSYKDDIKQHLSDYRLKKLGHLDKGVWKRKDTIYRFNHILPKKDNVVKLNILEPYRKLFYESELSQISYHKFFHHLNSSQAMCINFFFPLFIERKLEVILDIIGLSNDSVDYETACFEKESNIEKKGRRTSFDFYFKTKKGKNIYFEIKYTEYAFGKAKKDTNHKEKYKSEYSQKCSNINENFSDQDSFLTNYQLLRNLIHISKDSYVVLLYPKDNKRISKESKFAKFNLIKKEFQNHVIDLTWEELYDFSEKEIKDSKKLKTQIIEFDEKYRIKPYR